MSRLDRLAVGRFGGGPGDRRSAAVRTAVALLLVGILAGLVVASPGAAQTGGTPAAATGDAPAVGATNDTAAADSNCIDCHQSETTAIYEQYEQSRHAEVGTSCLDCHEASAEEPSSAEHYGNVISVLVTPKDCRQCHDGATEEFKHSMHDEAALFAASAMAKESGELPEGGGINVGENSNALTHFSTASAESGCLECHGSNIKVTEQTNPGGAEPSVDDVKLVNYPNQGIGRLNPDGSVGSCSSCHVNHEFSMAQARKPEACSECHMGPDHPQSEIYEETKHSSVYAHNEEHYNMSVDDPTTKDIGAPTCAVCHMTGLGEAESTHDVSSRLYWELEPVYSWPTDKEYQTGQENYQLPDDVQERYEERYDLEPGTLESVPTGAPNPFAIAEANKPDVYEEYVGEGKWWDVGEDPTRWDAFGGEATTSADAKRENMKQVCGECHTKRWVDDNFEKRDAIPPLYDAVFKAADTKYYDEIADEAPRAEPYDRSYVDQIRFEMWHHEGRRWRMGALMQGQDYEHWHGAHDVLADITELAHIEEMLNRSMTDGESSAPQTTVTTSTPTTETTTETTTAPTETSTTQTTTTESPGLTPVATIVALIGIALVAIRRRR